MVQSLVLGWSVAYPQYNDRHMFLKDVGKSVDCAWRAQRPTVMLDAAADTCQNAIL
jgi:hypothetical protein